MSELSNEEVKALFKRFIKVAKAPLKLKTLQIRSPPEPDVICQMASGEWIAYEITEASSEANVRYIKNSEVFGDDLQAGYRNLPPPSREAFRKRYAGNAISVGFRAEASQIRSRRAIPSILVTLLDAQATSDGWFPEVAAKFPDILDHIRFAGRCYEPDEPTFNLAGSFDPSDVTTAAVQRKLVKTYVTGAPTELIVFWGGWGVHHIMTWRESIPQLLTDGLGPFRKIWILGFNKIEAIYSI